MFQLFSKPKASPNTSTNKAPKTDSEQSASKKRVPKSSRQQERSSNLSRRFRHSSKAPQPTEDDSEPKDNDLHPLNLPPEERERRRFALAKMSTDRSDSSRLGQSNGEGLPSSPSTATPGSFYEDTMMGNTEPLNGIPSPSQNTNTQLPPVPQASSDAESYKAAGNKFFKAGDFQKAITEYGRAIATNPTNSTYLSNRSAAYMGLNRYKEALEDAKQADQLEPGSSKILLRLARIYTALGRPSEALSTYSQIRPQVAAKDTLPASTMQAYIERAESALLEGTAGSMVLHALDQAERGLGATVDKPRKWKLMRAEAYLKMGNVNSLGDAQNIVMPLLRSNGQDPDALALRGRILYAQGENEKAMQHFRQALNYDPDLRDAVKYLRMVQKLERTKEEGNVAFKDGQFDEAVRLYGIALEVDPLNRTTNSRILQNRALASIKVRCLHVTSTLQMLFCMLTFLYTAERLRFCHQ